MLQAINPTKTNAWAKLSAHFQEMQDVHMKSLFAEDQDRFSNFKLAFEDILLDYSKNIITKETLALLLELAKETKVKESIDSMFSGQPINETEGRSVLHIALRNRSNDPILVDGEDVMPAVNGVLDHMKSFSDQIISGEWKGYSGKAIKNIVNIGIGGSH